MECIRPRGNSCRLSSIELSKCLSSYVVVSYSDGHGLDVGRCEVDAVDSALTRIWLLQERCSSLHTTESTLAIGLGTVQ